MFTKVDMYTVWKIHHRLSYIHVHVHKPTISSTIVLHKKGRRQVNKTLKVEHRKRRLTSTHNTVICTPHNNSHPQTINNTSPILYTGLVSLHVWCILNYIWTVTTVKVKLYYASRHCSKKDFVSSYYLWSIATCTLHTQSAVSWSLSYWWLSSWRPST